MALLHRVKGSMNLVNVRFVFSILIIIKFHRCLCVYGFYLQFTLFIEYLILSIKHNDLSIGTPYRLELAIALYDWEPLNIVARWLGFYLEFTIE